MSVEWGQSSLPYLLPLVVVTVKLSEEIECVMNAVVDIISDTITMSLGKTWHYSRGSPSALHSVCGPHGDGCRSPGSLTCCFSTDGVFLSGPVADSSPL